MSTLAEQLAGLRGLDAQRLGARATKSQPSYLFLPREAAAQTLQDIHGIGYNGFFLLMPKHESPTWSQLEEDIFGEAAKATDRTLLDKEANARLDGQLERMIRLLGPSVLLRPCGQVLEWLIRRFRVQDFNVKAIFGLFLPYHETPQFVQMLQLLKIEDDPLFSSLVPVKASLQSLPRHILIDCMIKSIDLLRFVAILPSQYLANDASHRALIAFWTVTLSSYLDRRTEVSPGEMSILLPAVLDVLRRPSNEAKLAAYVVIARLSSKVALTTEALSTLVIRLAQSRANASRVTDEDDEAMLGTLAIVCAQQDELDIFPSKAVQGLLQLDAVADTLSALAATCDMIKVLKPLVKALTKVATSDQAQLDLLRRLLQDPATSEMAPTAAMALFEELMKGEGALPETLVALLSIVHQREAAAYEAAAKAASDGDQDRLRKIMSAVVTADVDDDTAIAVGIGGDSATLRILGLRKLLADPMSNASLLAETLTARLRDHDLDVAQALFEGDILLDHLDAEVILDACRNVIGSVSATRQLISAHVAFLAGPFVARHPERANEVVFKAFWPKLLVVKAGKKTSLAVWAAIKGSKLDTAGLLSGCAALAGESGKANAEVAERIASNIENEEQVETILERLEDVGTPALLAMLVLLRLAEQRKLNPPALLRLLHYARSTPMAELAASDAATIATTKQMADDLFEAVYAKPTSSRTSLRLRVSLLLATLRALPETQDANEAVTIAYRLAHTAREPNLAGAMLSAVFASIGPSVFDFLLDVAGDDTQVLELRLVALKEAGGALKAAAGGIAAVEWLPTLLTVLASPQKQLRAAGVALLHVVRASLSSMTDASTASRPRYLPSASALSSEDASVYMDALTSRQGDIIIDQDGLANLHATLDGHLKRAIFEFYISHAIVNTSPLFRLRILEAVRKMSVSRRLAITLPLFRDIGPDVEDRYLDLLVEGWEKPGKALDSHAEGGAYDTLKAIVEGEGVDERLRKKTLQVVGSSVFAALKAERRLDLLRTIVKASTKATHVDLRNCIRLATSDIGTFKVYLEDLSSQLSASQRSSDAPATKRSRTSRAPSDAVDIPLAELTLSLELFDIASLPVDTSAAPLLPTLFGLIGKLIDLTGREHGDITYSCQLLVTIISSIVGKAKPAEVGSAGLQIESVIRLLKVSANPQLAQRTLLLIAQLTEVVSTQIVPHVMPIFTFVGNNMLQRDDVSSTRVIEQTLDSIVPALVRSARATSTDRAGLLSSLREVIMTFTSAAPHVPRHKRAALFTKLARTLGAHDFLAAVLMLLVDQQSAKVAKASRPLEIREALELPMAVHSGFAARHQLAALIHIVDEIGAQLQHQTRETFLNAPASRAGTPQTAGKKQTQALAAFVNAALAAKQLTSKVASARSDGLQDIDVGLQELAKRIIVLTTSTRKEEDAPAVASLRVALQALVGLTPPAIFSEIILWLVDSPDLPVVINALTLLRRELRHIKRERRAQVSPAVNAVLRKLTTLLGQPGAEDADGTSELLQTVGTIARGATAEEMVQLAAFAPALFKMGAKEGLQPRIATGVLDAVEGLISALGSRGIPFVKDAVSLALSHVPARSLDDVALRNQALGYALLQSVVVALPTFLGDQLGRILSLVTSDVALAAASNDTPSVTAQQKLTLSIMKRVEATALVPALTQLWPTIDKSSQPGVLAYLDLLTRLLKHVKPSAIADIYKAVFRLFLVIFDYRRDVRGAVNEQGIISAVETRAVVAYIQLVLKLSDNAFRPLFLRTCDWALVDLGEGGEANEAGRQDRAIVLFRLVDRLLGQLKEVVAPYYAFVLDASIDFLTRFAAAEDVSFELWELIATSMTKGLLYAVEGYWTSPRLSRLIAPCVDQLKRAEALGPQRVAEQAGPLIVQLAITASDQHELVLKAINTALLARMRTEIDGEAAQVAAVRTMEAVWRGVGDAMASHVSEALPVVLECLEADAPVERATRSLVAAMEDMTGEGLLDAQ